MTVMCALRLLGIEQRLADDAVVDSVTAQVRLILQPTHIVLYLNAQVGTF